MPPPSPEKKCPVAEKQDYMYFDWSSGKVLKDVIAEFNVKCVNNVSRKTCNAFYIKIILTV